MRHTELNNMINRKDQHGMYELHHDTLAIEEFKKHVEKNFTNIRTKGGSHYLNFKNMVDTGIYSETLLGKVSKEEFTTLMENVIEELKPYESFASIESFYNNYSAKDKDGKYAEHYEDAIVRVAIALGSDYGSISRYASIMARKVFQPATPTFLNAGKAQGGELISCFLLECEDSLDSIGHITTSCMQLSKIGGGVAVDLSNLRPRGSEIQGVKGVARGVVPVLKILEDTFSYVDQLGQRPGAGAGYINAFHMDVLEFLDTKKINADEKSRIQTLSLGLNVPDKVMELAKLGEEMMLFDSSEMVKYHNVKMNECDFNVMYDIMKNDDRMTKKSIDARKLLETIAITQFESGYPYIVYIDEANRGHANGGIGKIKMSNLCTEIFQLQTPTNVDTKNQSITPGYDVSCNLGSLNLMNYVNDDDEYQMFEDVGNAIKFLSGVSESSDISQVVGVKKANDELHAVGLGVMNLHGYLASKNLQYDSKEGRRETARIFSIINFASLSASASLAHEKGTYAGYEKSDYASGKYAEKYTETLKKQGLWDNGSITPSTWECLFSKIEDWGLYNSYRLTIAPTQSISYLQNSTPSISPIVNKLETRVTGKYQTYVAAPGLSKETWWYYKDAYTMKQEDVIKMSAVIQPHVDQGISTVLYVTSDTTTQELTRLYYVAHQLGLKSLYYTRTKNLTIAECETCSV